MQLNNLSGVGIPNPPQNTILKESDARKFLTIVIQLVVEIINTTHLSKLLIITLQTLDLLFLLSPVYVQFGVDGDGKINHFHTSNTQSVPQVENIRGTPCDTN